MLRGNCLKFFAILGNRYSLLLIACAMPGDSSSNAARRTSSTRLTKIKSISSFTLSGSSERSFSFLRGSITLLSPALCAANTFSLIPPTGRTSPLKVISPVMAVSERVHRPLKSETRTVTSNTSRWTVFANSACWEMNVHICALK